jgi:glutamate formiminotransferase
VAYNVWLDSPDPGPAGRIAAAVRDETVRTLGLVTGDHTQVSMNLIAPSTTGPAQAVDRIIPLAASEGVTIRRCELVGLLPHDVLMNIPRERWEQLDVSEDRTIEARLDAAGISR